MAGNSFIRFRQIPAALGTCLFVFAVASPSVIGQDADSDSGGSIAADLFQFAPSTLPELVDAARITQKLDRTGDAKAFLKQILNSQPGENELRAVREEIGIAAFLDLRSDPRLLPESAELLKAVSSASQSVTHSDQELQELVQALGQKGTVGVNAAAELIASGEDGIPALLAADVQTPAGQVADKILKHHARDFRRGLLKLLDSSDDRTRVRILRFLSSTADRDIAMRLLRWQFTPEGDENVSIAARDAVRRLSHSQLDAGTGVEAADILIAKAEALIRHAGVRFSSLEQNGFAQQLTGSDPRAESLANAGMMLSDALLVNPNSSRATNLMLVTACAGTVPSISAAATVGAGQSSEVVLNGLATALELPNPVAAIEFLRALRAMAPAQIDLNDAGEILRQALLSPDARVRYLATDIVRRTLPVDVSAISLSQSELSLRSGNVKPEVVIVNMDVREARTLQAVLQVAGYSPQTARTGPEGFELAVSQMNCELFLLSAESSRWTLPTTLANLRADVRTRNTPIVVIGPLRFAKRMKALAEIYPGVWFLPEPVGKYSLGIQLELLNLPAVTLTTEDRAALKKFAE